MFGVKMIKRQHLGWIEYKKKLKNIVGDRGMFFGRWQYIYSFKGNHISLIFVRVFDDSFRWEIHQVKGKDILFDDVERFDSKMSAEIKIRKYLHGF